MSDSRRADVLLTVSGSIPATLDDDVAAGRRPRADYVVLADRLDAEIVDVGRAISELGRVGRALHRLGGAGPLLAWYCFRRRRDHRVILTDGEQVGIPLAMLERVFGTGDSRHVMIVHILSVPKKSRLMRACRLTRLIDRYLVYSSRQGEHLRDVLDVSAERVVLTPFMVDTAFFSPDHVDVARRRMICSAGLERRDYPTMIVAIDGLDVDVVIAAASPWSKWYDSTAGQTLPDNVVIDRLDLFQLRRLYAEAEALVMPLEEVDFQAGITTILEAMSMALPIVCTRTSGQTDTIEDGVTGHYVPPGDAAALRRAIVELLDDPAAAAEMGRRAREWVVANADVERYADGIAEVVAELAR